MGMIFEPLPADSDRGRTYNPLLPQIEKIAAVMKGIADSHGVNVADEMNLNVIRGWEKEMK